MSDFQDISVLDLLPQRPPFVMVDKLVYFDRIKTVTEFLVQKENIFFEENRLSASGLIENVAQTCAVRMGYINHLNSDNVKLGFIGAVRNFNISRNPVEGEMLTTSIIVKQEVFQMTLVEAQVESNGEILVQAEMKIALSDIDSQK